MKLCVILAVGLRPKDLAHAPALRGLGAHGFQAPLDTVFPAVTCTAQASFLTGLQPSGHGAVGNGWYWRDLAQIMLWRQPNQIVRGEKLYEAAAAQGMTTAKMFWWWNMYAPGVNWSVTPRPEYHADGLKKPGLYSEPQDLHRELQKELGILMKEVVKRAAEGFGVGFAKSLYGEYGQEVSAPSGGMDLNPPGIAGEAPELQSLASWQRGQWCCRQCRHLEF